MTVGAIVPVHGWAPYLAETLDAVLAEQPDDVVVVDDGSPRPLALLAEHARRVRVVRLERRHGLARARAAGMAALETDLIALCDGDDVWEPQSLRRRREAIGDSAACFARALIIGPDGRPTGERWEEIPLRLPELYEHNPLCVSGALLRREAVERAGGLECDLERAEDWDLWLRMLALGERLVFEPRAVVRYRRRPGALSGDIATLAGAQLELHARHAGLVDGEVVRRVRVADLRALAAGLVRERRYSEARAALRETGTFSLAVALPGVRALMGRRDPFRG